jgi:phosphoserine aminotransferase
MNVPFSLTNAELSAPFLESAAKAGLTNLKGHRLAGGVRASMYNAMSEKGVDALIHFMDDFLKQHSS